MGWWNGTSQDLRPGEYLVLPFLHQARWQVLGTVEHLLVPKQPETTNLSPTRHRTESHPTFVEETKAMPGEWHMSSISHGRVWAAVCRRSAVAKLGWGVGLEVMGLWVGALGLPFGVWNVAVAWLRLIG